MNITLQIMSKLIETNKISIKIKIFILLNAFYKESYIIAHLTRSRVPITPLCVCESSFYQY
jgi:hypothetical protein